jgi:hypothetical protein
MATGSGSATIDFGALPGSNEAQVDVTGQTTISSTSSAEAYIFGGDTSSSHTASDHRYLGTVCSVTCGVATAGTGFTIYARSLEKLTGTFTIRYIWAD